MAVHAEERSPAGRQLGNRVAIRAASSRRRARSAEPVTSARLAATPTLPQPIQHLCEAGGWSQTAEAFALHLTVQEGLRHTRHHIYEGSVAVMQAFSA